MIAVLVTALATWLSLVILDTLNIGDLGFLAQGTIAVLIGAGVGLLVPWLLVRRRRQNG